MPRAYDRRQLPVDRDPLKQLDTNYGKLPKFVSPFSPEAMRESFKNSLRIILGIDFNDEMPFLTWLQERPFWTNLIAKADAARLLAQSRIRAGTNLVSDPNIDYPQFWDQMSIAQVDDSEVTPYDGDYALKLTSLGANAVYAFFNTDSDGNVEPIKVRRGDMFIVEARVFAPTANATGNVQLIGRVRNSRTGDSEDIVITFVQMSGAYRGQWQKLAGTVEIPAGYDEFSAGLRLPANETTATQPFYGDQFVIREATDSQRLFAISRLLARRGSNLLIDPSVDDPVFWNQQSAAQVGTDVVTPSSGDTALQIISRGADATDVFFNTAFDGTIEPVTVRLGEVFAVEARVLSPAANNTGSVSLIARLENSRTENTTTTVLTTKVFDADTKGSWQNLIGYITIPLGYNRLSVGLRLPAGETTQSQPYYADELVLRETTAVQRLFEISKLRSRRGSNLVTDASIEDPQYWTQTSAVQVGTDVVTPSSGSSALQVTSRGATGTDVFFNTAYDGSVDSITARLGEYYAVEARVFSPTTNTTGSVSLIARFENSRTGASTDVVITTKSFDSAARGSWEKLSGYVKVPSGYNRISAGLRLPAGQTTSGQPYFADELVIREATLSQRLFQISRLRTRRGSNLVTDPNFDDPEFWTQPSTAPVDYTTVIPYAGNNSLQVTSRGATATEVFFNTVDDGSVEPLKVRAGETYEVAAYVYSPAANANGVVTVVARLSNARTGATSDVVLKSVSFTSTLENSWQLLTGFVKIPVGYNQLSAGLALPAGQTTAGNQFYVNEALIRESTAAKRLFDLSRRRIRHGANLLSDANFDDPEFWTQESATQVDSTVIAPRTGNYSLQITSRGATATSVWFNTAYDGAVEPIRARLGERYYVECYVYSPAANSAATVQLVARLANAKTGATTDEVIDTQSFDTLTEGQWQKLSGYVKITAGYNLISAGIVLGANQSSTGNVFFVDDALLRETTAAQRIIDVLFDGFNGSTGAFGKDPDEVYGAMDGVKDGVRALRLARQRAKVGPNFINDPRIEDSSFWTQTGSARSEAYARNGGSSLEVTRGAAATYAWWNTVEDGTVEPLATWEGDALYLQCWFFAPAQTGGGTVQLVVKAINSNTGASAETVLKTVNVDEGGIWKKLSGVFIMPEGADAFSGGVKVDATGSTNYKVYFDALTIREATAVQRLANVSKLRTRAGNNLVLDPNFDDLEFWVQDSTAQVDSTAVAARTGNYSLQITSRGSTATAAFFNTALDGAVVPIKTRFNEHFYVECYVYSPAANANATVKLIARLANVKTGASTDVLIASQAFTSLTEGQWQKLSGYVKITAGYNLISAGILLDANQTVSGNTFLVDDALIREVTAAQRMIDTLFDGFSGSTGTFGKDPDDVYGEMGVIGDGTKALQLARARAKVGPNFVNDPRIEDVGYWQQTNSGRSDLYRRGGAYSLQVTATSGGTYVWWNTIDGGTIQPISTWLDDVLFIQCFYYAPTQTGTGTVDLVVKAINSYTGVEVQSTIKTVTVEEGGGWKRISGVYTMPDGADGFSAGAKVTSATAGYKVYLDSLLIREATAVQRLTNVAKLRTRSGNNLVSDPNFDDTQFWTQTSTAQVDSTAVAARTGNYSLQITSRGATATTAYFNTSLDGTVEPIKTRFNEHFYVECYVYSPTANANATVKLVAKLENAKTGANTTVVLDDFAFTSLSEGVWQKLSGYVKITAGYNLISAGILLDANQSTAGNVFFADDALIREVTAAQRMVDVLFDGFNGSTGTFGKDPDDVYGTMGVVADGPKGFKLAKARAKSGNNFVNDPRVEDAGYWTQTNITRSNAYRRGGAYSLQITATGTGTEAWWNTLDGGTIEPISTWLDDSLFMQCFYYAPTQTGTATMELIVKAINSYTGAVVQTTVKTVTVEEGGLWKKFSGVYTMPDGADSFSAGVKVTSATAGYKVYVDSLLIREATAAQKLIDGLTQAFDGGTSTGNDADEPKKAARRGWAALWDGLTGNTGTQDKTPVQVAAAAATVRDTADTAAATADSAAATADTAQIQVLNKMLGGTNIATNPGFEDTTQVLPFGAWSTYSTEVSKTGSNSVKIVADAVNNCRIPLFTDKTEYLKFKCNPGEVYQYEAQVYGKATNTQIPSRTYSVTVNQGYTATVSQTYTVNITQSYGMQYAGTVTGGTYTLSYNGLTTAALAYNAASSTVQTELQAIVPAATVNSSYTVSLPGNGTLTANSAGLTGGGTMAITRYSDYRFTYNGQNSATIPSNTANSTVASTLQAIVANGTVTVTGGGASALSVTVTGLGGPLTAAAISGGSISVSPTTIGTFTLTYGGQTTPSINRNAAASSIQTQLRALSTVGSTGATVTQVAGGFTVLITGINSALTGSGVTLAGETYTLTYGGKTTATITPAATASTVKSRIEALTTVGAGRCTVTPIVNGSVTTGYSIVIASKTSTLSGSATVTSVTVTQSASSTDGYITFGTLGFDAAGSAVTVPDAGSLPATTALNGKWTKFSTYWTVPDGVFSFCPVLNLPPQVAANETYYVDEPLVREVTVATQALNQSNLVLSGDFEDSTVTRYTDSPTLTGAYSGDQKYAGTQSYKLTMQAGDCGLWLMPHNKPVATTVPGLGVPVQENQIYYFEVWYFLPSSNQGIPDSVKLVATMTDGAAVSDVVTVAEKAAPTENSWQQLSGSYTVPAGYKFMFPQFRIGANGTAGDAVFIDKTIIRDETNQATWKTLADTFLGGISTTGTLTDATGALNTIYNTVLGAADTAADLKTERTANASAGRNYVINFSKYPERLMGGAASGAFPTYPANTDADFTLTYSGAGSGSLSILDGQAHWTAGAGARSVFGKYRDSTLTDYQLLSGTLTTPMRAGGGQNWIIGRCNASNDTFVYAFGYANSLIDYRAELGCYVNGVKTVFATASAPPNFNLSMRVGAGTGSGVRRYQVLSGSKVIIDYQDTGLVSRLCSANHSLPANHTDACTKYRGWAFQSVASGAAVPGDAIQVACADADPTAVVGSGAKISRSSTSTVNASNGRNVFPSTFFNVVDEISPDLVLERNGDSTPTGKITVTLSGWYLIEVGFRVNPTVWSTWNVAPAVFKNGDAAANVFKVGHDGTSSAQGIRYAHSSFIAYLSEGEWIRPGYDADKAISNVFTGSSTAESYVSITLLNRSYD